MLELILLYRWWHRIGAKARAKGHAPLKYQFMLLLFWFGGEFSGAFLGVMGLGLVFSGNMEPAHFVLYSYLISIGLALTAVWGAFKMVDDLPDMNVKPPEPVVLNPTPETRPSAALPAAPPGAIMAEPPSLPPIPLDPAAAPKPSPVATASKKETEADKDSVRELIETIVFVVVLVLMLKTFLAEAFVIPTGSMADTLLGYHYKETCADCKYPNLINASAEAEPQGGRPVRITGYKCTNCGQINTIPDRRGGRP